MAPLSFYGLGGAADLDGVPAVWAGRWNDRTSRSTRPSSRGRWPCFPGGPPWRSGGGVAAPEPPPPPSCDSVPDRFGAEASILYERERPRSRGRTRRLHLDARRSRAGGGAVAVLFVSLDDEPGAAETAFAPRAGMRPDVPADAPPAGSAITRAAAERLFGGPVDQVAVGTEGAAVSGHWDYAWRLSEWPARNVVAVLPGSDPEKAGEYVLVSAHNDHVGVNGSAVDHDSLRAVNKVTRRQGANDPVCRPNPEQQQRSTR